MAASRESGTRRGGISVSVPKSSEYELESIAFEETVHYRLMREFILDWRGTVDTMLDG